MLRYHADTVSEHPEGWLVPASDYNALAARLAEAERDAARYRWLRDRWLVAGDCPFPNVPDHDSLSASHVDDAFDAAMTADSADVARYAAHVEMEKEAQRARSEER